MIDSPPFDLWPWLIFACVFAFAIYLFANWMTKNE
jgi:hypothetical protein